jgi:Homing endonuclease associated repeat
VSCPFEVRIVPKPKSRSRNSRPKVRNKEQIVAALKAAARKLGHAPTSNEFTRLSGITINQVRERFGGYRLAVRAAGLTPRQWGLRVDTAALLEDWGKAARQVGGVPSRREYERLGSYWYDCLANRFQAWSQVPAEFSRFAASGGLAGDWTDVLETIRSGPIPTRGGCPDLPKKRMAAKREAARLAYKAGVTQGKLTEAPPSQHAGPQQNVATTEARQPERSTANPQILPPPLHGMKCVTDTMLAVFIAELAPTGLQWITAACFPRRPLKDRPLLGAPMSLPAMAYEPVNEMGVMVLFSMMAHQLGFVIESVQSAFPDCEAKIEVEPGRWQHFRIEFEYESRGFKQHGHDPSQCDLIVCWRHNWKNCPPNIQVLELSKLVAQLSPRFTPRPR